MRVKSMTLMVVFVAFPLLAAAGTRDACEALTKRDVAAVQGQPFADTKLTTTSDDGLAISQCFYRLPSFANSITLTVMSRGDVEKYWESHYEADGGEEEHGTDQRVVVKGIGEEAFWTGNRLMGELIVRGDDAIVRISVGGAGTVEQKIEKSKRLARAVLKRM